MNSTMVFPKIKIFSWSILAVVLAAASYPNYAFSQSAATGYQTVGRDIAVNSAIDLLVYPGRATAIDFSSTDEALAYVLIADPFSNLNIQIGRFPH